MTGLPKDMPGQASRGKRRSGYKAHQRSVTFRRRCAQEVEARYRRLEPLRSDRVAVEQAQRRDESARQEGIARDIDAVTGREDDSIEDANRPVVEPNDDAIAFYSRADDRLPRVDPDTRDA